MGVLYWLARHRRLTGAAVLVAGSTYLWASSPGEVVVRADGSLNGVMNDARELLQGKVFWLDQCYLADQERESLRSQPAKDRQARREIARVMEANRREMDQYYRDHPESRPTQGARQSEALREMADRLDEAELDHMVAEVRNARIKELGSVLQQCEQAANESSPEQSRD